jgi:hypothetical protein
MRYAAALSLLIAACAPQQYTLNAESLRLYRQAPPEERARWVLPAVRTPGGDRVLVRPDALTFTEPTGPEGGRLNPTTSAGLALVGIGVAHIILGGILAANPSDSCEFVCSDTLAGFALLGFGSSYFVTGGIMALASMHRRDAEVRPRKPKLLYH